MRTVIMMNTLLLFSVLGCGSKAQSLKNKELLSVSYHAIGMRIDDNTQLTVSATDSGYIAEKIWGYPSQTKTFKVSKADFDKLAELVLQMKEPKKESRKYIVLDFQSNFSVRYLEKGKPVYRGYSSSQKWDKKTNEYYVQAIGLMRQMTKDEQETEE